MPLYVYRCNNCEHQFEVRQSFSEDPLSECPQCVGQVRRVINSVGVVFKGSGFYVTDTRNGKSSSMVNASGSAGSDDKGEKSEKSEKKAETGAAAPAAKSETKTAAGPSAAGASAAAAA